MKQFLISFGATLVICNAILIPLFKYHFDMDPLFQEILVVIGAGCLFAAALMS